VTTIPTFEEKPEHNAGLASIEIEFPRLQPDTSESCPIAMDDIQSYLAIEDGDGESIPFRELRFVRTAAVAEQKFWIWRYQSSSGAECFVTVSEGPDGATMLGMDENYYHLSPEQFMLGTYHNVF
jgi:hypothetical protein